MKRQLLENNPRELIVGNTILSARLFFEPFPNVATAWGRSEQENWDDAITAIAKFIDRRVNGSRE
ncbi:MAG: hypothetical protein IH991_17520 [Planctomycetes bacterium]|nr:hypothetical protein [Planctomycetota bacterium]